MKKYLLGIIFGFLSLPWVVALFLYLYDGPQPFRALSTLFVETHNSDKWADYKKDAYSYDTDYKISGTFLDEESHTTYQKGLMIFEENPIIELGLGSYESACIQSFNNQSFDVAITLSSEERQRLIAGFATIGVPVDNILVSGTQKRYFMEIGGDRVSWFWVSESGARSYQSATQVSPDAPDFVISVPMGQLYNFQAYTYNSIGDAPLGGCTSDINPEEMPGWNAVATPFWQELSNMFEQLENN